MIALKLARDVVGTVGLLFLGYIALAALPDAWRYIKMSKM
jgi:hypothetical protein